MQMRRRLSVLAVMPTRVLIWPAMIGQRPGFAVVYAHCLRKLNKEKDAYDLCKNELDFYEHSAPAFRAGKNSPFIDELRKIVNVYETHHQQPLID